MRNKVFFVLLCTLLVFVSSPGRAEITAESVLGEYWKDPLFGVAAESRTVQVEILSDRLWPGFIEVPVQETIRFVFLNRSKKQHLFAFTLDLQALLEQKTFQKFIADELFHANHAEASDPRSHTHASSSVDDAEAIVKELAQRPTVFLKPGETKEILVRFNEPGEVLLSCVIDRHNETLISGKVEVVGNE
jgi:uncharacterized cupredoxin-like copper-binding protein